MTDVTKDCFYQHILSQMNQSVLDSYFGNAFMIEPDWFDNWGNRIEYEQEVNYPRESYMLGVWMNSVHYFGLPERASSFKLRDSTLEEDPYRLYAVDLFIHQEWND